MLSQVSKLCPSLRSTPKGPPIINIVGNRLSVENWSYKQKLVLINRLWDNQAYARFYQHLTPIQLNNIAPLYNQQIAKMCYEDNHIDHLCGKPIKLLSLNSNNWNTEEYTECINMYKKEFPHLFTNPKSGRSIEDVYLDVIYDKEHFPSFFF